MLALGLSGQGVDLRHYVVDAVGHELQTVVQIFELGVLVGEELGGGEIGEMVAELLLLLLVGHSLLWVMMERILMRGDCFVLFKHPSRFFPRDALSGRDDEFVDLEAIWYFCAGGSDAEAVCPGRYLDLIAGETSSFIDEYLEVCGFLLDLDASRSAKVSVGEAAVPKSEGIYCMVGLVIGVAIIHETSDTTAKATVHVDDQSQPIEFADGIYAVRRYLVLSIPGKPYLEVTAAPFRT